MPKYFPSQTSVNKLPTKPRAKSFIESVTSIATLPRRRATQSGTRVNTEAPANSLGSIKNAK